MKKPVEDNLNEKIEQEFKKIKKNLNFYHALMKDDLPISDHKEILDVLQYVNLTDEEIKQELKQTLSLQSASHSTTKRKKANKKTSFFARIGKRVKQKKVKPQELEL